VVTSQKQLEIHLRQLKAGHAKLDELARRAIQEDRDDLAVNALTQAETMSAQIGDLESQIEQLATQRENLQASAARLQAKVISMRTSKESLKAQYGAAKASVQAGEAVLGLGRGEEETALMLERAREKMLQTQARAEAMTELMESGALATGPEAIESQLNAGTVPAAVAGRMAELKAELAVPQIEPAAGEASPGAE
jgi:phage shock protein A